MLPFKLRSQTKGLQKAHAAFQEQYGDEADRIFLQKAQEQGTGKTLRQKANSIYKKGGHLSRNPRRGDNARGTGGQRGKP